MDLPHLQVIKTFCKITFFELFLEKETHFWATKNLTCKKVSEKNNFYRANFFFNLQKRLFLNLLKKLTKK
jgi:hypothetical protein